MTEPIPISSASTGRTTTRVPGGRPGRIDPVCTSYGVAPASRGTTTATARTPPAQRITNHASTRRTNPSAVRMGLAVHLGRGHGDVVEHRRDVGRRVVVGVV